MTAPLPAMDVAGRAARLRSGVTAAHCDVLVITHLTNIRYLTGFTGSAAVLVLDDDGMLLVTDGRYEERAAEELDRSGAQVSVAIGRTVASQRDLVTARVGAAVRVALEADHVSWSDQRRFAEEWFPSAELVPTAGLVEELRAVKDPGEVARIEAACVIADDALSTVRPMLEEHPTELEVARALDAEIRLGGAEDVSFETIVASGANGSRPHHTPGPRRVERGDLVVIDFGAMVAGYHSDMTRTIAVGGLDALDDVRRRMVEVVTAAQAAGVAAVRAGGPAAGVDAACRSVIEEAGWGDAFLHGTGHGVGLDIHEAPSVSSSSAATLADGHVVTVEPGVYLPGHGGVRIEDTVVVTESGCRTLTCAPKS